MKTRGLSVLAGFLMTCALAAPAAAGPAPYVRLDWGGSQYRMTDANALIRENEAALREMGWPAEFAEVGAAYGPGASLGLWLFPGFRVGATCSYLRAVLNNGFDVPDHLLYVHEADLRVTEIGVEAAVRFDRLMGLTLGGSVGRGRGELIEGLTQRDPFGLLYQTSKADKTETTYGGFIGLEQTNDAGVVGYIFAGFQYRDMGRMDSKNTATNGVDTVRWDSQTIPLDYSGYYVKAGIGYDFGR